MDGSETLGIELHHRPARWAVAYRRRVILTDAAIVVAVLLASQGVRFDGSSQDSPDYLGTAESWTLCSLLAVGWLTALAIYGAWRTTSLGAGPAEYRRVAVATGVTIAVTACISYLTDAEIARGFVGVAFPLGLVSLLTGRWVWRLLLREHRRSGTHLSRVLVIGGPVSGPALVDRLRRHGEAGYRVVGLCLPGAGQVLDAQTAPQIDGVPVIGGMGEVYAAIRTRGVDTVAVASTEAFDAEQVKRLAWNLEGTDIRLVLSPALTDVAGPRIHVEPVAGLPLLDVQTPSFTGRKVVVKSVVDYGVAAVGVVLLSPVFVITAVVILLTQGGPVFYRPARVGREGRTFRLLRFQTRDADGTRVTAVGRVIRRAGIDQSAQLFNVLAGDMSLVGARPLDPDEELALGPSLERRLKLRPGIIGPSPVFGRNRVYSRDSLQLDLYYVENWSLSGDLVILAHAVRSLFGRRWAVSGGQMVGDSPA